MKHEDKRNMRTITNSKNKSMKIDKTIREISITKEIKSNINIEETNITIKIKVIVIKNLAPKMTIMRVLIIRMNHATLSNIRMTLSTIKLKI